MDVLKCTSNQKDFRDTPKLEFLMIYDGIELVVFIKFFHIG